VIVLPSYYVKVNNKTTNYFIFIESSQKNKKNKKSKKAKRNNKKRKKRNDKKR
jgi:hypothetical protein